MSARKLPRYSATGRGLAAGRDPGAAPKALEDLCIVVDKQVYERRTTGAVAHLLSPTRLVEAARAAASEHPRQPEYGLSLAFEASLLGVIEVQEIDEDDGPCRGAWQVKRVAGPRYAEVLYGIGFGLSPSGLLAPDRNTVSKQAARVWQRQAAMGRRALPFDRFSGGARESCLRYRSKAPFLDFAFEAEGWEKAMVAKLKSRGLMAVSRAKAILKASERDAKDALMEVSWNFWEHLRPKAEEQRDLYYVSSNFED